MSGPGQGKYVLDMVWWVGLFDSKNIRVDWVERETYCI